RNVTGVQTCALPIYRALERDDLLAHAGGGEVEVARCGADRARAHDGPPDPEALEIPHATSVRLNLTVVSESLLVPKARVRHPGRSDERRVGKESRSR